MNYTDQQLNAFLDNQLSEEDTAAFRNALIDDGLLSKRLESIAFADSIVQSSYSSIDSKPLPQDLVNLLADTTSASKLKNAALGMHAAKRNTARKVLIRRSIYLAVLVVLVLGVLDFKNSPISEYQANSSILQSGRIDPHNNLHEMLETAPSGIGAVLDSQSSSLVTPVLTFRNRTNQYCREFTLRADTSISRSVACRETNNEWNIKLSTLVDKQTLENEYTTASSTTTSTFERYVNQMIENEPFSAAEELDAINQHWK